MHNQFSINMLRNTRVVERWIAGSVYLFQQIKINWKGVVWRGGPCKEMLHGSVAQVTTGRQNRLDLRPLQVLCTIQMSAYCGLCFV